MSYTKSIIKLERHNRVIFFAQRLLGGLNSCFYVYWSLICITDGQAKELPTYKDNDFINDGQKIYIDEENKKMFLEKLRKDVEVRLSTCQGYR